MMTNEKLTEEVIALKKRVNGLEAWVAQQVYNSGDPEVPIEPPVDPPTEPSYEYDYELDLTRSHHIDFNIGKDATVIIRLRFAGWPGKQSMTHLTAVLLATGPCIKLAIPEYGYEQRSCREETSENIATDDQYTDWVVSAGKYIYLHVINTHSIGRVRLRTNGENLY